jgi:citrate synthase
MEEKVQLTFNGKSFEFPIITGSENEKAFDISALRSQTSLITLDSGFGNTGACTSAITFLDGEKGILRYRGIPIEQIAEHSTFVETAYLIIYGHLPTEKELNDFSDSFTKEAALHKDMLQFFKDYPKKGHPMGLLSCMVSSLSGFYPELLNPEPTEKEIKLMAAQLLAKVRTIGAYTYRKMMDKPYIPPRKDLKYIPNFLHMMFSTPKKDYKIEPAVVDALRVVLILHADHEQNCSTSTVRMVGSSWANMFASVSAGVSALWGPLHGGANQQVVEMLQEIHKAGGNIKKFVERAKDPNDNYRLMGFGHRVYKNFDPRCVIIKQKTHDLFKVLGIKDPLLDIAVKLEEVALKDEYFVQRKLYPNVDFYSGLIFKAIGIPVNMFPVMFAIGRMPGWIAHWKEMKESPQTKIARPRQIYTGKTICDYVPIEKRR